MACVSGWDEVDCMITCWPLAIYAVAGFFVARQLFLGAEDVAWAGTQIFLPMGRGRTFRWLAFGFQQKRGPWSALICKELQLQEITIILVPLLMLLHLALLALRHFAPQWMGEGDTFRFTAVVVWMMASWVIGCVAVAEERRYNTLESLLCLPVRQRHQFAVKLAVVMALGTVVGGVFPWVLEHLDGANSGWTGLEPLIKLVLAAAVVTAIAFFASTMSRGMLQAFAVALLFSFPVALLSSFLLHMTSVFLMRGIGSSYGWNDVQSPAAALFGLLIWPAMIAACIWLGYRNYKSLQTGWRLWAVNFAWLEAVFAAVLFVSCAGSALLRIYAR
jgi:ABC-type transport system involved in multi-copper enzyme maturation permease subunit